ncbi:MAG TPA: allophanate hydrolase [Tepidisphaeraceae bacterium]|nr:allophanate hydrolase [Tepidisphaeraceae bacterium]
MSDESLDLTTLSADYAAGRRHAPDVLRRVGRRMAEYPDPAVWISRLSIDQIDAQVGRITLARSCGASLPLYGIPFAVKDNIDIEGQTTTAACPAFGYLAKQTATVVQRLCDAGAILVGKTNLDQFATGLVGTRSPYGQVKNAFNPEYISGGSSSGSAIAVAAGLVSFALGTDTAGSGRIPAGFNNIIGYKPTRGALSTTGVVPACRSLDCVSIFSLTCDDAAAIAKIARGYDPLDSYSRPPVEIPAATLAMENPRIGVPPSDQLEFFGNAEYAALFRSAAARIPGRAVEVDIEPFLQAATLLYDGPWIAERLAHLGPFLDSHAGELLPVIAEIFAAASCFNAADAFAGQHRLAEFIRLARQQWQKMDALLLPTAATIYRRTEIESDPIQLNKNLGRYTNFVNLMDLCAVAVPAGFTSSGLPFGVTLIAPAGQDEPLLHLADAMHRSADAKLGATAWPMPPAAPAVARHGVLLAVVGAHLSGFPLNKQLTERNAELVRTCRTAPCYRLYALPGATPPKPGLVCTGAGAGAAIEVEVWRLSLAAFGDFVSLVPPPLCIGTITLDDGSRVKGFLCENHAIQGAADITHFGGWRDYCKSGPSKR